jgi:hypothetical protein
MTAIPPVGPSAVDPTWPAVPVERVRERGLAELPPRDGEDRRERRRRRPRRAEPPAEPPGDHVDVRA